jgi:hypothetical protein
MNPDLFECELFVKQIKKDEMCLSKVYAATHDPIINDHSRVRCYERILHPKSNANIKLLEKIDSLKESKDERLHSYFNKIIKNVKNGKLDLH